jgi:putative peptidoglycan lipid II flippase
MKQSSLTKAAGIVAFLTVISKILGFIRETSLAAVFGATYATDAYLVAQTIPYLLFSVISYALTTTFIPVYALVREEKGPDAACGTANTVILAIGCMALILILVGEAVAERLVAIVAPGFEGPVAELTVYLSRIIFPMMFFQLLSGLITGILQAEGEFGVSTAAGLVQNISIIVSIVFFGPRHGIEAVALGTLIGAAGATLVKLPALRRTGFRWRKGFSLRNPGLRRMLLLMPPAIVGAGAGQINTIVDRMLASGLPEGRVAALNYANRLMNLAPGILGASLVTVMYPRLAGLAARRDWKGFSDKLVGTLSMIHFLLAPIAMGAIVLREPLVRIVYERGVFDGAATRETAWALLFLSLGMPVFTMRDMVSRSFFALQDTRTPMVVGLITVGINVLLNLLLVGPLEQGGLALATSIASLCGLIASLWLMCKRAQAPLGIDRLVGSVIRVLAAAAVMGGVVWWSYPCIDRMWPRSTMSLEVVKVTLVALEGAIVYATMAWMLRVEIMKPMIDIWVRVARSLLVSIGCKRGT